MALFFMLCLNQMKKILTAIMLLLLTACAEKPTEIIENRVSALSEADEKRIASFVADNYDGETGFSIGTGIVALNQKDSRELSLYPIYENDRLIALAVKDGDMRYVTDDTLENIRKDVPFLIVNDGLNIIYVDRDRTAVLDGEIECLEEKEIQEMLKRIKASIGSLNPLGRDRKKLVISEKADHSEEDRRYRNDRIIVSFKEGDKEKMISDFEMFCGGKAQSGVNTTNIYVFVFEPLNEKDLYRLLEESRNLDYVSAASLDQKHETNGAYDSRASE